MKILELRKLNLLFKLFIAISIIIFSLLYQSIWYNFGFICLALILIKVQNVRLIRFRSISYGLFLFLLIIFIFRSFSGYGKIFLNITNTIKLTSGGIYQAIITVEQFLLVFLYIGLAIYSSSKEEIYYYFRKFSGTPANDTNLFRRIGRIGLFVIYLLPELFTRGTQIKEQLNHEKQSKGRIKKRMNEVIESIGNFVVQVLQKAESRYPEFVEETEKSYFRPLSLWNKRHLSVFSIIIIFHGFIIWI